MHEHETKRICLQKRTKPMETVGFVHFHAQACSKKCPLRDSNDAISFEDIYLQFIPFSSLIKSVLAYRKRKSRSDQVHQPFSCLLVFVGTEPHCSVCVFRSRLWKHRMQNYGTTWRSHRFGHLIQGLAAPFKDLSCDCTPDDIADVAVIVSITSAVGMV